MCAQRSWPWSTVLGLGDGAAELNEAYSREFLATYFLIQNPATEGVSKGVLNELEVTGVATPLAVGSGSGICYGLYINDADTTIAVTTPAVGTTGGRVVLQTNWAGTGGAGLEARTRIAVIYSADGNPAIPALTQAFGTTWEISLATFTVTTGGVITVTDDRTFRRSTAMVDTDEITDLAVTTAKIDNLAVTEGKIGNDSVDDTKVGNRVPQFYRRQGGSATVWSTPGTTTYTPTSVRMQSGVIEWVGGASDNGQIVITYPTAFSFAPNIIVTPEVAVMGDCSISACAIAVIGATGCALGWCDNDGTTHTTVKLHWLAIGPE